MSGREFRQRAIVACGGTALHPPPPLGDGRQAFELFGLLEEVAAAEPVKYFLH
jgi:hypothetical protein